MISYAQNGEDVVLERLFRNQIMGHYIDVGAGDPTIDSVTKHFYDRGWRGVNVEPDPTLFERCAAERPEDVNIRAALSNAIGSTTLYVASVEERGLSTLVPAFATAFTETAEEIPIEMTTLAKVCDEYATWSIDFLKIDVEGSEQAVLAGGDWEHYRPRVVVVESTLPNSSIPSHEHWQHLLDDTGYCCVLFDGLNRFYVLQDDLAARSILAAPANTLDHFRRADLQNTVHRLSEMEESLRRTQRHVEELSSRLREAEMALAQAIADGLSSDATDPSSTDQSPSN